MGKVIQVIVLNSFPDKTEKSPGYVSRLMGIFSNSYPVQNYTLKGKAG